MNEVGDDTGSTPETGSVVEERTSDGAVRLVFDISDGETHARVGRGVAVLGGRFPPGWSPLEGTEFSTTRDVLDDPKITAAVQAPGYMTVIRPLREYRDRSIAEDGTVVVRVRLAAEREPVLCIRLLDSATRAPVEGACVVVAAGWRKAQAVPIAVSDKLGRVRVRLDGRYGGPLSVVASGYFERRLPGAEGPTDAGDLLLTRDQVRGTLTIGIHGQVGGSRWGGQVWCARMGPPFGGEAFSQAIGGLEPALQASLKGGHDSTGLPIVTEWTSVDLPIVLADLWPGEYVVVARHPELGCAATEVELKGEPVEVSLTLSTGALARPATPLAGDGVLELRHQVVAQFSLDLGPEGVEHVPAGAYDTRLRLASGACVVGGTIDVETGGTVNVPVPEGGHQYAVVGRLVLAKESVDAPLAATSIRIAGGREVATAEDGRFEIGALFAGSYRLLIPGYRCVDSGSWIRDIVVKDGGPERQDLGDIRVVADR